MLNDSNRKTILTLSSVYQFRTKEKYVYLYLFLNDRSEKTFLLNRVLKL